MSSLQTKLALKDETIYKHVLKTRPFPLIQQYVCMYIYLSKRYTAFRIVVVFWGYLQIERGLGGWL